MDDLWTREDLDKITAFTARDYFLWLQEGLDAWDEVSENRRAFEPIRDRFTISDDIEPQLADMFSYMNEREQREFLAGIALGFAEVDANEMGYAFFDSLQRLTKLIERSEPIEAMVARICDSPFLDVAREDVAQHLYAGAFLVIEAIPHFKDTGPIRRLMALPHYDPAYDPKVQKILTKISQAT